MNKQFISKKNIHIPDILYFVLSAAFLLGSVFVFNTCGPKDDGSWMVCHWAGRMVSAMAILLTVLALQIVLFPSEIKAGLYTACFGVSVLTAFIPGHIIKLCMMKTMRCHLISEPSVIVCSVVLAVYSLVRVILLLRKKGE